MKTPPAVALILAAAIAASAGAQTPKAAPRGDVNLSGTVTAMDAQAVLTWVVGLPLPKEFAIAPWGDVNCTPTAVVSAIDAQLILSHVVGVSTGDACVGQPLARVARIELTPINPGLVPGSNLPLALAAFDSADVPLTGRVVHWQSSDTTAVSVSSAGLVTGQALGSAIVSATSEGVRVSRTVTVGTALPVGSLEVIIGDSVLYFPGLRWNPIVQAKDQAGRPLPGVDVTFTIGEGGGGLVRQDSALVQSLTLTSDAGGQLFPVWQFGNAVEALNTVTATANDAPPLTLTALTVPNFDGRHSCELSSTNALYCWGLNNHGQLGDGTTTNRATPVLVDGVPAFKSLATGIRSDFTCAIAMDDVLYCWGHNNFAQLGDGTRDDKLVPTAIGGALRFKSVSLGFHHACGVTTDGDVYCWGANALHALGSNADDVQDSPIRIGLTPHLVVTPVKFSVVSAGGWHSCALSTTNLVHCWGNNNEGQIGDGTLFPRPTPTPIALPGTLTFSALGAGERHTCAVTTTGAAYCWGANFPNSQLGDGSTHWRPAPTNIGGPAFAEIAGAAQSTCARTGAGDVWCWGSNSIGQLGDGTFTLRNVPARSAVGLVAAGLRVGRSTTCARSISGLPYCWGNNAFGALGDGSPVPSRPNPGAVLWVEGTAGRPASLAIVGGTDRQNAVAGTAVANAPGVIVRDYTGAVLQDVSVTFAVSAGGGNVTGATVNTDANGVARAGSWTLGAVVGAANTLTATVAGVPSAVITANASVTPAAITIVSGNAQVHPIGFSNFRHAPTVIVRDAAANPAANVNVTFAVTGGGGLVNGSTSVTVPTSNAGMASVAWTPGGVGNPQITATMTIPGNPPVPQSVTFDAQVVGGIQMGHSCHLTGAGSAYCWGAGSRGQIGDGTLNTRSSPTAVIGGLTFGSLASGMHGDFSCALTSAGAAYCWGSNDFGQLGDGTTTSRSTPTPVSGGLAFTTLAAGTMHACGVTTTAEVYCWGSNSDGQVGDGSLGNTQSLPTRVPNLTATAVTAHDFHTCAIAAGGSAKCWGHNAFGRLGDGTFTNRRDPTPVLGGLQFASISAGAQHTCGVTTSGAGYCWGANASGELGNGPPGVFAVGPNSNVPVQVSQGLRLVRPGLTSVAPETITFESISAGRSHSCGLSMSAEIWCWGADGSGQTGKGTFSNIRTSPDRPTVGRYTSLRATANHTCAKVRDIAYPHCWGAGGSGQLGEAAFVARSTPRPVSLWPEGTPGVPARFVINDGNDQSAITGSKVATSPSVQVRDYAGNLVLGSTITLVVTTRGEGCTPTNCANFVGSVTPGSATTNVAGIAAFDWTLGASTVSSGFNFVDAILPGDIPPISFSARSVTAPTTVTAGFNAGSAPVGYGNNISVTVRDGDANPIANVPVSFTADPGNGSVSQTTVLTSATGFATTFWQYSGSTGSSPTAIAARASVAGLPPSTFTGQALPAASGSHTCALRASSNTAYCWGANASGQLGTSSQTNAYTPAPVSTGLTFAQVAMGRGDFNCGLTSAGAGHCWGANHLFTLGAGSPPVRTTPLAMAMTSGQTFTKISVGEYNTCVLDAAEVAICGGWSRFGVGAQFTNFAQLNNGIVAAGNIRFSHIAVGERHACGISSGALWCWGENISGQLGNGNLAVTQTAQGTPVAVSGVSGLTFVAISAGSTHSCAITNTGAVYCWGSRAFGQTGNGFGGIASVPVSVPGTFRTTGASPIVAGTSFTCAIRDSDSRVMCWGRNEFGQLGDGTQSDRGGPTQVTSSLAFTSLVAGSKHACAFESASGTPFCWGNNDHGQLGDGSLQVRTTPTAVRWPHATDGTPAAIAIVGGNNQSALINSALPQQLTVRVTDANGVALSGVPVVFTTLTSGDLANGTNGAQVTTDASGLAGVTWQLGSTPGNHSLQAQTSVPNITNPPPVTFTATATSTAPATITIISGNNQTVPAFHTLGQAGVVSVTDGTGAPMANVTVRLAGLSADGRTGDTVATTAANGQATFIVVAGAPGPGAGTVSIPGSPGVSSVTFNADVRAGVLGVHGCDISNAQATVYCWGSGGVGELGNGQTNTKPAPAAISSNLAFSAMASGMSGDFSCALATNAAAHCWGANNFGQLGDGTLISKTTPVFVSGALTFASISTGRFHSCGLTTGGSIHCWGWNGYGQLGTGDFTNANVPTALAAGGTYKKVVAGWFHTCAIRDDDVTLCWGFNGSGQIGNGQIALAVVNPTAVQGGQTFASITAGGGHSCGLTAGGVAYCWGGNWRGQLGDGTAAANRLSETVVSGGVTLSMIAAGNDWTCAIESGTNKVFCWGGNWGGQLGDGTFTDRNTPTPVADDFRAIDLRPGVDWTCARSGPATKEIPYCWGRNGAGQLGDGTFTQRNRPAATRWLFP